MIPQPTRPLDRGKLTFFRTLLVDLGEHHLINLWGP